MGIRLSAKAGIGRWIVSEITRVSMPHGGEPLAMVVLSRGETNHLGLRVA